jgi:hypothetical protein
VTHDLREALFMSDKIVILRSDWYTIIDSIYKKNRSLEDLLFDHNFLHDEQRLRNLLYPLHCLVTPPALLYMTRMRLANWVIWSRRGLSHDCVNELMA